MYSNSVSLDNSDILDWYDYFYGDFVQEEHVYVSGEVTPISSNLVLVKIIGSTASLGTLLCGGTKFLGVTQIGINIGIIDYSRKDTNAFGVTTFTQRSYSKRTSVKIFIENTALNGVYNKLASLRATPALWILTDDTRLDATLIYGYYKDFNIDIQYNDYCYCSLELEGLT
jgi:hypothetical protein